MTRRQALALSLVALVLTAFSVALSTRDSRDWRASRTRRLLPFPWKDARKAVVKRPDGDIALFRDADGQWKLELQDNLSDNLNPNATEALAALATLAWREKIAEREPPDPKDAVTLAVVAATGQTVSITLGDVRNGLRSAIVDGDAANVYGVNQNLVAFLDWPRRRFRSMLLAAPGGGAKPVKITLSPADPERGLDVTLEQREKGWAMLRPVAWPVDENRLDIIVRWLDRLRAESIAAEMAGDLEYFGFGGGSAFVEATYKTATGEIHRKIEFGGDAGDGKIYARETGRSPIFTLPREALAEISLDLAAKHPDAWRNFFRQRALDRIGHETPEWIVVEKLLPEPVKLTIARAAAPAAGWKGTLEENGRSRIFAIDAPDGRDQMMPLAALFTGLASLRVKAFLADDAPGPDTIKWTAYPAWRFSMRTADGRDLPGLTLYAHDAAGKLPGGEPYADGNPDPLPLAPMPGVPAGAGMAFSVPDREAVMETFSELSYLLCLPPYRYQSRRLIDSDAKEWTRIDVIVADKDGENDGKTLSYIRKKDDLNEQWQRAGEPPQPLLDDNNRLVSVLVQLSQLRAEGFVQDVSGDVSEFGLDRPTITAIVYSSSEPAGSEKTGGPLFTLTLGDAADDAGRRFARLGDDGPVFLVSPQISDALGIEYK